MPSLDLSRYRGLWVFAMFDLPVVTEKQRKRYTQFRKLLLKEGFDMLQYSVYARYFPSEEASAPRRARIKKALPPEGQVRMLVVTDRQFEKMECYVGKKERPAEPPPDQMLLL